MVGAGGRPGQLKLENCDPIGVAKLTDTGRRQIAPPVAWGSKRGDSVALRGPRMYNPVVSPSPRAHEL